VAVEPWGTLASSRSKHALVSATFSTCAAIRYESSDALRGGRRGGAPTMAHRGTTRYRLVRGGLVADLLALA